MLALNIYSLDDKEYENAIACLKEGKYIIGRGDILKVTDKRVSRKHAVIEVSRNSITLTSIHVNPCFFKAAHGKTLTVISSNQNNELNDGDQFALLPDSCWFKVKINRNHEADEHANDSSDEVAIDDINNKRCLEDSNSNSISKKAKLIDEERLQSTINEETYSSLESSNNKEVEDTDIEQERLESITEKTNTSQSSTTCVNVYTESNVNVDTESTREHIKGPENDNNLSPNDKEQAEEIKAEHTENDNKDFLHNVPESINDNFSTTNQGIKEEPLSLETSLVEDSTSQNNHKPVIKTENNSSNEAQASGSNDTPRNERRERCWYGDQCFRKNPYHRETFSHPGDQDYDSDPEDDRPNCPYGTSCYRKNIQHRRQFKHIGKPAPKQKQDPATPNQRNKKAATKRVKQDESSEDDYDYSDPFLNDGSSDDYEPSNIDSNESSDWSEPGEVDAESSEVKRMLREAKRFTKKK